VKVFGELGAQAFKAGQVLQYRIYCIARDLVTELETGGSLSPEILRARYNELVKPCSDKHWRQMLADGMGIWWRPDNKKGRIYIEGLENVCDRFEIPNKERCPGDVHPRVFRHLRVFKAWVFGTWLGSQNEEHGKTISCAKMAEAFGVTVQTIWNWRRDCGVEVRKNVARIPISEVDTPEVREQIPERHWIDRGRTKDGKRRRKGGRCICWQIPSTYWVPGLQLANRGMTTKTRGHAFAFGERPCRVFFGKRKDLEKQLNRDGKGGFYLEAVLEAARVGFMRFVPNLGTVAP